AMTTLGMALGSPWRGRALDRVGLRRALLPSVFAEAVVWGCAPFVPYSALLVVAFIGGVLGLPLFTVVRQSLSVLVPDDSRRPAYTRAWMGVELSFMAGPALGVAMATTASTQAALLAVGVLTVLSGLAMMALNPPVRSSDLPGSRRRATPLEGA